MNNYEIVKIGIDEYDKCSNIWNMKGAPFTADFKNQIIRGDRSVYVYKKDGEYIASGDLVVNMEDPDYFVPNKRIYLSHMIVKKEYRNQGIGSILIDFLINQAKAMGFSEIALGVDADNENAIHLYNSRRFTLYKACEDEYGKFYKLLKEDVL